MLTGRLDWEPAPFNHCVIDDFLPLDLAKKIEAEFPAYDNPDWYVYDNAVENKKTLNLWHKFPPATYKLFSTLCQQSIDGASADYGLHGGGWHIHESGGNLNPHLDYEIHPLLRLQRCYNLILFLSSEYRDEYGGHLGLWSGTKERPDKLEVSIAPRFNRCVIFDTTKNSWHGLVTPIDCPKGVYRKSIATYYLKEAMGCVGREKALFYPRPEQMNLSAVHDLIKRRVEGVYA